MFNVGDMVGRGIASPLARCSPWASLSLACFRTALLPLFFLVKRADMKVGWNLFLFFAHHSYSAKNTYMYIREFK